MRKRFAAVVGIAICILAGMRAVVAESVQEQVQREPEPYRRVLGQEIAWLTNRLVALKQRNPETLSTITLRAISPAARVKRAFPRHRFYAITYSAEQRYAGSFGIPVNKATTGDQEYLYIVGPTGKHYKTLRLGARADDYIKLLQDNRFTVRSGTDARLAWTLYRDLQEMVVMVPVANLPGSEKGFQRQRQIAVRRFSPSIWELDRGTGEYPSVVGKQERRRLEYRLRLRADRTIASVQEVNTKVRP